MSDLVTWLREQIDQDERLAQQAPAEVIDWIAGETSKHGEPDCGAHIGRHGPARVLREVEAKRAILNLAGFVDFKVHLGGYGEAYWDAVKLLASVYADRPGWRDEWST